MKKKGILPSVTTWWTLRMLGLVGISRQTDKYCMISLTGGIYKNKRREKGIKFVITREWGFESGGFEWMYSKGTHFELSGKYILGIWSATWRLYSFHCYMLYLKLFKSTFSSSHHEEKAIFFSFCMCEMMDVSSNHWGSHFPHICKS